jgi:hypothetical protein
MYDRLCESCGKKQLDCYEAIGASDPACDCGGAMKRAFIGRSHAVIGDDIIGGETLENVGHEPVTFYSKSEKRRYLREHGLESFVRHVGRPGSDKSPYTTRWI